jgi:glycosyltransferase involved in cell wall biosynthesis
MHVVIVDEELPFPLTSGKRIRTLNLVRRLAIDHQITYICHRNEQVEEARQAQEFFAGNGIQTLVADRAVPRKSGLSFYGRLAANLFSSLPYSVSSHRSPSLRRVLQEYASSHRVDLWQCEWTPYAEVLRGIAGIRPLIMAHNIESLIWRRYYETEPNPLKRWYIGRQWKKFERFEKSAFANAAQVVAVSAADAALAQSLYGTADISVVDNGVDTSYFQPDSGDRHPATILFLGSLDWRANQDGLKFLVERVFPFVRAALPHAQLEVVGRKPPPWLVRQLAATPGVHLTADVADVRPFLRQATVMAVPLRVGGGSRLKILEALASALPVVSTTIGAEGLALSANEHLALADGEEALANALIDSLRNPAQHLAAARRGCELVRRRYDWDVLAQELERIWSRCASAEPELLLSGSVAC